MSSARHDGTNFWGVLINSDKSPAPLLEGLCLGIAQIMTTFDDYATSDLTPERLAAFYRKVGGNYDVLFLETKPSALSFIYQRLGCFHSIQPSSDPYKPPSIPALQPNGFVRWQTIQLLLDPEEHSRYLQVAVELWDIHAPSGEIFPKPIPREAFPRESDREMVNWHEEVSRRFEVDYRKKNILRSSPPNFGTYHFHFSQKVPPGRTEDTDFLHTHRTRPVYHRNPNSANEVPLFSARHHQHHLSRDLPRRAQSTYFPRPENLRTGYASPRAPSPPPWSAAQQPKPKQAKTPPCYSRPVSPSTVPVDDVSDASSEGSSPGQDSPPRPSRHGYSYHRHLSPPRASHVRRHSHEAYARKPHRDLSPSAQRHHVYNRDAYAANHSRLYDSDGARRPSAAAAGAARRHRPTCGEPPEPGVHPGVNFHEQIFNDQAEVPVYASHGLSHRYAANPYLSRTHAADLKDSRRNSYHHPLGPGTPGGSAERPRFATGVPRASARWAGGAAPGLPKRGVAIPVVDEEYPPRGRRSTMYER
ncbi:hypothetical protein BDV59DRAFT_188534 [Aspergillus ambiguus]|uniref:uncharacterized protein n=1 Tax=Aspergillus ambiguus TaxID=176160 RepID=UPI003CCD6E17